MTLERHYSLSQAARVIGVSRVTLKKWLAEEAMILPPMNRGERALIRESDLENMLRRRRVTPNFALLRGRKAS